MIRFQTPELPPVEEIAHYFARSEADRWFSNGGPCHELLGQRLREFLGGTWCVAVANGTMALMVGLRGLVGARPDGPREILLPSFTFVATINAVLWSGLEPVFVDVDSAGWHLDPACLRDALDARGDRVAAILACSTFGVPPIASHRRAWERCASDAGVPLLVDSAAGFGAVADDGDMLGRQGTAEIFSFHATKPFAIGEGGVVTTRDPELAERLTRLTNFGLRDGVVSGEVGLNAKLAEWPAATALAVLDRFGDVIARRRAAAERMWAGIDGHGFRRQIGTSGAVWQFVPVLAPTHELRDAVLANAARDHIQLRAYYAQPLHRMAAFREVPVCGELPCTEGLAERVLSLPMANDITEQQVDRIAASLTSTALAGA